MIINCTQYVDKFLNILIIQSTFAIPSKLFAVSAFRYIFIIYYIDFESS